jgi:hypothetical protein
MIFTKRTSETLDYIFDFSGFLGDDDSIIHAEVTVSPNTLTLNNILFSAKAVKQYVSGGITDTDYTLTANIVTAMGRTKRMNMIIRVVTLVGDTSTDTGSNITVRVFCNEVRSSLLINDDTISLIKGMPVYISGINKIKRANLSTGLYGLVETTIDVGMAGYVIVNGLIELNDLNPGYIYYLTTESGIIASVPSQISVGIAESTTILYVQPKINSLFDVVVLERGNDSTCFARYNSMLDKWEAIDSNTLASNLGLGLLFGTCDENNLLIDVDENNLNINIDEGSL